MAEKIPYFQMANFRATDTLYNLFEYFQCKDIDLNKTLKKPQYTNGPIKEHIPRTVKRKKVPALEIPESSVSLSSSTLPILSWKLRIIACRGRSMIPTSCKLELFCPYVMPSWHYIVTKSSIIVDMGVRYPPLVCLFSVQKSSKRLTNSTFTCSLSKGRAVEQGLKFVQS